MLELAKESKEKVTDLVQLAKTLNIEVKNAMSSISDDDASKIMSNIDKIAAIKVAKKAKAKEQATKVDTSGASNTSTSSRKEPILEIGKKAHSRPTIQNERRYTHEERRRPQTGEYRRDNAHSGTRERGEYNRSNSSYQGGRAQGQGGAGRERSEYNRFNSNYQGGRPQGQGGAGRERGEYNRSNSNYQGGRPQGQGGAGRERSGYNSNYQGGRAQGQGGGNRERGGYNSNYQGGRAQGQGGGNRERGGYNSNYQGGRPQGQGGGNRGGYNNNYQGGRNQGGANRGGYNNRSGMDNRNIDRKLSDISSNVTTTEATKSSRNYNDNKTRRGYGEERKSKKQLKEERLLEERNLALRNKEKRVEILKPEGPKIVKHKGSLTVGELSQQIGVPVAEIIKYLLSLGIMATINHSLDSDAIELIAAEYDAEVQYEAVVDESDLSLFFDVSDDEANMETRPPVITIMGHVDHGKTTLLDTIRKANVAAGESGGITQHIGAYQITYGEKLLTFLDTPGHEAFTSMRARGAQITDIAIIVVAADDGVMPQTKEAVEHAKAAEVPIIVAVNKMDKPDANPQVVMQGLTELGLQPEAWGGDTVFVEISAKAGDNIDGLLEMVLLVAEVQELKANPNRQAFGTVIEARLDKGRGAVATLLVQGGTLHVGDPVVVGNTYGRVRTMEDDGGSRLKDAAPSTPVELTGLIDVPSAGDQFAVFESEKKARQIGEARAAMLATESRQKSSAMNLEDLNRQILEGEIKDINVIVKGDVQGSVEAVVQAFSKIEVQGVRVKIVREAVGGITESDVMLAIATNAIIYGFNVRPDANTRQVAEAEGVSIELHSVIYKAIEELEQAMTGMLDPEFEEVVIGQAEVRQLFKVTRIGTIAGCMVTSGELKRDSLVRLIRNSVIVYDGRLGSLKREQDDVKSVSAGYECGLTIDGFNDLKAGDIVEAYEMQEIERK